MNANQLQKFKGALLNCQNQISQAVLKLTNDADEQQVMHRLKLAEYQIKEAIELSEKIKAREAPQNPTTSRKKKNKGILPPPIIIVNSAPKTPTYNIRCRNYSEIRNSEGTVIERGCTVGMDMDFCSKNCAYATNNICPLKG